MAHAFLGPSGLDAALLCQLKIHAEKGLPNNSNRNSAEGTAAHELAAKCLETGANAAGHIGEQILVDDFFFEVDADMARHVQTYVDYVRELQGPDGILLVEQSLSIEQLTGEVGAKGTADAVVIVGDVMHVVDLKYGMGVVVEAEDNAQLRAYGVAALWQFDLAYDIRYLELHIVQPRV